MSRYVITVPAARDGEATNPRPSPRCDLSRDCLRQREYKTTIKITITITIIRRIIIIIIIMIITIIII